MAHARLAELQPLLTRAVVTSRAAMRAIATAGTLALGTLALLLLARRLGGGLSQPIGPAAALLVSLALGLSALVVRLAILAAAPRLEAPQYHHRAWLHFVMPGVACYLAAVAMILPGTSAAATVGLFGPLSLMELAMLAVAAWSLSRDTAHLPIARFFDVLKSIDRRPPSRRPVGRRFEPDEQRALPEGVTQQMVRSRTPEGLDALRGTLRAAFAVGQRTEVLHVAFCPPFESPPRLEVHVFAGSSAATHQVQVFPHGARIELRLNAVPSAAIDCVVSFSAVEHREPQTVHREPQTVHREPQTVQCEPQTE